jgi:acyl-CoA reductase-like NAD-dependent aldehyde dehydrogenase
VPDRLDVVAVGHSAGNEDQVLCAVDRAHRAKLTLARRASPSFEGDLVDRLLDLVDDHVGELGALLAVQSLT